MIQSIKIAAGALGAILITGCSFTKESPPNPIGFQTASRQPARSLAVEQPAANLVTITANTPSIFYRSQDLTGWTALNTELVSTLTFLDVGMQGFFEGSFPICTNRLTWEPPAGIPAAGFRIYYGQDQFTEMIDVGYASTFSLVITNPPSVIMVGATSYDEDGQESDFSNIIVRTNQIFLLRSALKIQVSQ